MAVNKDREEWREKWGKENMLEGCEIKENMETLKMNNGTKTNEWKRKTKIRIEERVKGMNRE